METVIKPNVWARTERELIYIYIYIAKLKIQYNTRTVHLSRVVLTPVVLVVSLPK
jgi:hypothetical protein